ncbi:MAG: aromatic-ring-hydroxylating dioxygenase subunit beta [Salinirussus sp.]
MNKPDSSVAVPAEIPAEHRARADAARRFLYREAELLDERQLEAWLDLLTDDIEYEILMRSARERDAPEFSDESFHVRDDRDTLETRVERLQSEFAWVEHPPTRTKRFVSNVRLLETTDTMLQVRSNVLMHRSQGDTSESTLVSGERRDNLRIGNGTLRLAQRRVFPTHTRLPFDRLTVLSYI